MKRELVFLISIFLLLFLGLLISGCDINNINKTDYNTNKFRANDSVLIRDFTFYNCQHLINQTMNFTGKIVFEECGKKCLGECPYEGPDYCYYGIQNNENCTVYIPSRIDALGNQKFKEMEKIFNQYEIGQQVTLEGTITLYYDLHCYGIFSCNYFMLEKRDDF